MGLVQHPTNTVSERTLGAAIEVHRHLGPGLLESAYRRCLSHELTLRGLHHRCEVPLPVQYKGTHIQHCFTIDFRIEDVLIVELKALERLLPVHSAQLMTYMRLSGISAGLLINFNVPLLTRGVRRLLL